MTRIAVVVPVYNARAVVEGCLAALDAQTLPPDAYEVVAVDDGSTDGTPDAVERFARGARARVRLVRMPANRGPAAARNAGLAATGAPVVAFTDGDCEPAPDWLERALAHLDADASLAAVEGRIEPKGDPGTLTHQMRNTTGGQYMTANMTYRRAWLEKAGRFDERFRRAYLEDSDVAFGVIEGGGTIAWAPDVVVHHLVLPEGRRKFSRDARKHFFNPLVYRKHPKTYVERLRPLRPAFPRLYVRFMLEAMLAVLALIIGILVHRALLLGLLITPLVARGWWRIAYVHRARDPLSFVQAGCYPFMQTFWVVAGAIRFRAFSTKL